MAATWGKGLLSGVIFGSALTAAGVYEPAVIVGQMRLEDFHMLKAFIAASASSALAIVLANRSSLSNVKPRPGNSIGLFGPYDGNILGGLLLGSGMTLTGACPGTVLPQVATSVPSGPLVLLGGVLGGILWSGFGRQLLSKAKQGGSSTAYEQAGVSKTNGLLTYEVICLSVLGAATLYAPATRPTLLPPIIGGLLIGLSQFSSLLLTTNTLGISTAYEQIGDYFWYLLSSSKTSTPSLKSTIFAAGTVLGAWTVNRYTNIPPSPVFHMGTLRAIVGGVVLTFGSRMAGGCTSGHGISGMSTLSVSSFVTVAAMFVGGMGLAAVLR